MNGLSQRLRLLGLALCLSAIAATASAHPDIAITARVLLDVREGRLSSIAERWAFDAGFSRKLTLRHDRNGDGAFDADEIEALRLRLTGNLDRLGFLSELSVAGEGVPLGRPVAFDATIENGVVVVTMAFRLATAVDLSSAGAVRLLLRDRDYVAAVKLDDATPVLVRGDGGRCAVGTTEDPADAYFGGLVVPRAITLDCR